MLRSLSPVLLLLAAGSASAAELRVYPPEVAITGPNRTQQLIVVHEENGRVVADLTTKMMFASSNTAVAKVDAAGLVTAIPQLIWLSEHKPLVFGSAETDGRLPSVEEKLILHEALEAKRTPGLLEPTHVWAGVLRHESDAVRAILRALGLNRKQLLEAGRLA